MKSAPRLLQKIQRFSFYNTVFVQIVKSVKTYIKTYCSGISSYYEHVVQKSPQYESSCQHDRTNSQRKQDFSRTRRSFTRRKASQATSAPGPSPLTPLSTRPVPF
ncbi:Hypothetical_protein [Hexamita inflata]|uniref:Hypothetical_protein n=1 Tax=Hexamita inflata TaxID=28002 RepID=A0AA86QDS8_9EUKA|nr:Hypothetical protein HINF_LOCUS40718 [Hexamita inflata]